MDLTTQPPRGLGEAIRRSLPSLRRELKRSFVVGSTAALIAVPIAYYVVIRYPAKSSAEIASVICVPLIVAYCLFKLVVAAFEGIPPTQETTKKTNDTPLEWTTVFAGVLFFVVLGAFSLSVTFLLSAPVYQLLEMNEAASYSMNFSWMALKVGLWATVVGILGLLLFSVWPYRRKVTRIASRSLERGIKVDAERVRRISRAA